jgi:hypothetical protein
MSRPAGAPAQVTDASPPPTSHAPPFILDELTFDEEGNLVIEGEVIPPGRAIAVSANHDISFAEGVWYTTRRDNGKGAAVRWNPARRLYDTWTQEPLIPTLTPQPQPKMRDTTGLVPLFFVAVFGDLLTRQLGDGGVYEDGRVLTPDKRVIHQKCVFREQWTGGVGFRDEAGFIGFRPDNGDPPTLFWLPPWFGGELHIVYLGPPEPESWMDRLREPKVRISAIVIGVFLNAIAAVATAGTSLYAGLFLFVVMLAILFWTKDEPKVPAGYL